MLGLFLLQARGASGQADFWPDSIKRELSGVTDWHRKAALAGDLAKYYFGQNRPLSDDYSRQAIEAAEMSRDRTLMVDTYLENGSRVLQGVGLQDNIKLALESYRQAERIARENNLDAALVNTEVAFAGAYRMLGDNVQSLTYSNQAVATAASLDNDTVQVTAYTSLGLAYEERNQKLLAFRNYLKALDVAEDGKADLLIRNASAFLAHFYSDIREVDKAVDYELNVIIPMDRKMKHFFELRGDYNTLAQYFTKKQEFDIAMDCYEHAIRLADSIHFDLVKIDSYFGISNAYVKSGQYRRAMDYVRLHPVMADYLDRAGMGFVIDEIYANAFRDMRRFDSAAYFFKREEPDLEKKANANSKVEYYEGMGEFYKLQGMNAQAIEYYLKEDEIGKITGDLTVRQAAAENLDSLYRKTGDYVKAYGYYSQYEQYSDSLRNLSRETDLSKLEVDNDSRRRERQAREDEQAREHRHNVQYMGFTVGLVALFIALVMMGWLAVSPAVIRALGFLSFIFLFEFIILLTDKQIAQLTNDEPWKVLLIKIVLAAILLPLHHWSEHKVIHFLSSRKRLKEARR
jgi:tetratricopeptide (TPR) repeat protein